MYYATRGESVRVEERLLTLIRVKRANRDKRKREEDSADGLRTQEETPAPRTPDRKTRQRDAFDRLFKKGEKDEETTKRIGEATRTALGTHAWKFFLAGVSRPTRGFATVDDPREEFSKRVDDASEVEVSLVLSCVTVAKGLPPFFNRFCGHVKRFDGEKKEYETRLVVDRVRGRTLREYLSALEIGSVGLDRVRYLLQSVFVQVCLALSAMQKYAGFVHNDFHCDNVMIQDQSDGDAMVFLTGDRCYRFPEDTPRVRVIDYGHSSVVHPVHHRTVHSFTGLLTQGLHGADLARFCVRIVKWAQETSRRKLFGADWSAVLGDELASDIRAVLRHVTGAEPPTTGDVATHVSGVNDNVEWYHFDVGATPTAMLEEGACVRRFVVDNPRDARCAFWRNLYLERPDDLFDSSAAVSRFWSTEKKTFPVVGVRLSRWAVCDADAVVRNVYAVLKHHMVNRGIVSASGTDGNDDSDAYRIKNKDGTTKRCLALYFQKTDDRTRRRAAWRALVVFQRAVLLYLRAFVSEKDAASESLRDEIRLRLATKASGQFREEILLALCCYANAGEFSFFDDAETSLMRKQGHAFGDSGDLAVLRKKIMEVRDRVEFGENDGMGGGLFVDAQKMTHGEVYGNECFKKLFYTSSCSSFYVSAFVA